jgi:four helix bundle protein
VRESEWYASRLIDPFVAGTRGEAWAMEHEPIPFTEWVVVAEPRLGVDAVWKLPVYRLALYAVYVAWPDVAAMARLPVTRPIAGQLYRGLGSIGANVAEGYSRSSGRDRTRLYEYALGSARECVVWYRAGAPVLGEAVVDARHAMLQQIIRMLLYAVPRERERTIRPDSH